MSERKTSEIKLRVTPSFKAAVQLAAEGVGETMSVYMEKATEGRIWEEQNQKLDGLKLIDNAIATAAKDFLETPVGPSRLESVPASSCEKNCHPWEWCECKQKRRD